jgi:hypothetical protein
VTCVCTALSQELKEEMKDDAEPSAMDTDEAEVEMLPAEVRACVCRATGQREAEGERSSGGGSGWPPTTVKQHCRKVTHTAPHERLPAAASGGRGE